MANVTATNEFKQTSSSQFPVYCKYDNQFEAQPAFILLDIKNGSVTADYSGIVGGGCSAAVYHRLELQFPINPLLNVDQIKTLIDENLAFFQTILDGSDIIWDGNNWVGTFNDEALDLILKFEGQKSLYDVVEIYYYDNLYEAMNGEIWLSENQTIEQLAIEIHESLCDNQCWSDDLDSPYDIEMELLNLWQEHLYSGKILPQREAQILLAESDVSSEWLDELKEFAGEEEDKCDIECDLHYGECESTVRNYASKVLSFNTKDYDEASDKTEFLHNQLKLLCEETEYNAFDGVHLLEDFADNVDCNKVWFGLPI